MSVAGVVALLLCALFGWASASKVLRWMSWREALRGYGLSGAAERAVAFGVPAAEACVALLLALRKASLGGAAALTLISLFSLAVLRARNVGGDEVPCGCFGRAGARDYRLLLGRNLLIGALAGGLLVLSNGSAAQPFGIEGRDAVPAVLTAIGLALATWLVWAVTLGLRGRGGG
jgi:hypothetical protein